eukprot:m.196302 g.196302  ORF g.196302 m.196302 type:complete len:54 (-) comp19743_c0_seq1:157-318(-)
MSGASRIMRALSLRLGSIPRAILQARLDAHTLGVARTHKGAADKEKMCVRMTT